MKQVFLKALSTKDINICLNKFNHFIGAFAADEVFLKNSKLPQSFVINTDNKSESGEHWTALIIEQNNKVLFFDSTPGEVCKENFPLKTISIENPSKCFI